VGKEEVMEIFGVGQNEVFIIALLAVIILGPERLVKVAREAGKLARNVKAYFSSLSDELKSEMEILDEVKKETNDLAK
ncbi:MAG TPA: twin-arginine translocase TatA/TatE family subunit, partial [Anaerolineales bacterium]|nr:twin-arginine translocase TatA/TatE family subunit [Anaerolineales bacterium]